MVERGSLSRAVKGEEGDTIVEERQSSEQRRLAFMDSNIRAEMCVTCQLE